MAIWDLKDVTDIRINQFRISNIFNYPKFAAKSTDKL